jgi:hypothetical protein
VKNPAQSVGMSSETHRFSKRHVCDDCSTKRLVEDGVERRVSDGQFFLAAVDASNRLQEKAEQDRIQDVRTQKSHTALRLERLSLRAAIHCLEA